MSVSQLKQVAPDFILHKAAFQPAGSSIPPQSPLHHAALTQESAQQQQLTPRPCKLLLCGEEGAGQSLVAGALLKLAQGVQVHTISLPMLVAGGSGDASVGLVQLLEEAMHRWTLFCLLLQPSLPFTRT